MARSNNGHGCSIRMGRVAKEFIAGRTFGSHNPGKESEA